jgi:hypothetical protein
MRLFAQAVGSVSRLFASSSSPGGRASGTVSPNAPASGAGSTWIFTSAIGQEVLRITRDPSLATTDALFGSMDYEGKRLGVTMERTAVAVPEGTYRGYKRDSAHFGTRVVGIDVPNRTNIECHPANFPRQLDGCIAIGETKDGDALDNSRAAFDRMMAAVPEEFTVEVSSL